jgi:hypothetical protein
MDLKKYTPASALAALVLAVVSLVLSLGPHASGAPPLGKVGNRANPTGTGFVHQTGGVADTAALSAASVGTAAGRASSAGASTLFAGTDNAELSIDDPTASAWRNFGITRQLVKPPLASSYTIAGTVGVLQRGDSFLAMCPDGGGNGNMGLQSQTLSTSTFWMVTLVAQWAPYFTHTQYPDFGLCVSTGTTTSDTAYCLSSWLNNGTPGMHNQTEHPGAGRITLGYEQSAVFNQFAGGNGLNWFRFLMDGTDLHEQWSNNGIVWSDYETIAAPSSLLYYGWTMGSPGGGNGQSFAVIYENNYSTSPNVTSATVSTCTTSGNPTTITTQAAHNFISGDTVAIHGSTGNTAINTGTGNDLSGGWGIKVTGSTTFQVSATGNGSCTSGNGTIVMLSR